MCHAGIRLTILKSLLTGGIAVYSSATFLITATLFKQWNLPVR
jgi:hypothetical protein